MGQLASATVVADTFATKILTELNGEGSIKDKAGLAIDLCLKDFSKNEKFVQANLSELKKGASTVLTYRLTLLEEKTNEVREVFEKEAIPLSVGYLDALSQKLENPNALTEFLGKVELHYSSAPTNPITEELIKLLKKPERSTQ
ncbi:MAG TPA: hypothetical protein PK765_06595 [bacterium]|nr:hypothetical protein [bacterium]